MWSPFPSLVYFWFIYLYSIFCIRLVCFAICLFLSLCFLQLFCVLVAAFPVLSGRFSCPRPKNRGQCLFDNGPLVILWFSAGVVGTCWNRNAICISPSPIYMDISICRIYLYLSLSIPMSVQAEMGLPTPAVKLHSAARWMVRCQGLK